MSKENGQEEINEENQEGLIEVPEVEVEEEDIEVITDGMSEEELADAKEFGLLDEKPINEVVKDDGDDDSEDDVNTDPDNFEEMDRVLEKDAKSFHKKYTPNAKALYFKQKAFKKRFQERDTYAKELEVKLQELSDAGDSKSKLDAIAKLLKDSPDDLTIEQLQTIISKQAEKKEVKDEGPLTQAKVKERVATKAQFVFDIGNSKYEKFEDIAKLADEVVKDDTSGVLLAKIAHSFESDDVDESQIVESLVKLARLNDKYDEVINKDAEKKPAKESRIIKNSKKKVSSAAIGGAKRGRLISEDDLTEADIERMISKDPRSIDKLKKSTIDRILGKK